MKRLLLASLAATLLAGPADAEDIKLGVILGFTGPIESLTPDMASGAEMAMKEVSDAGGILPSLGFLIGPENTVEQVVAGDKTYSARADYFFQVVFVATAMSIVSGAVAERMKLWAFLAFAVVMTGFIYPIQGFWKWGNGWLNTMEVP